VINAELIQAGILVAKIIHYIIAAIFVSYHQEVNCVVNNSLKMILA
jgi:hypothetical protein